jgi:uncharacterized protein
LEERQLDFAWASELFDGEELTKADLRFDYGESRFVSFGFIRLRLCAVVWTQRNEARHIISMRKANDREKKWFHIETRPG